MRNILIILLIILCTNNYTMNPDARSGNIACLMRRAEREKDTSLGVALHNGHLDVVRLLIEKGSWNLRDTVSKQFQERYWAKKSPEEIEKNIRIRIASALCYDIRCACDTPESIACLRYLLEYIMNKKHVLSLSLLLAFPAHSVLAERCSGTVCNDPDKRRDEQLCMIARDQAEIANTQNDIVAGLVLLGTQSLELPKSAGSIDWAGEAVKIASLAAFKELANHHVPAHISEINIDLPGLPNFTVLNPDQAVEVLYAMWHKWSEAKSQGADAASIKQMLINTLIRTYGREKALQVITAFLRHACPEGSCPLPQDIKEHWLTKLALGGAARYTLDYLIAKYVA